MLIINLLTMSKQLFISGKEDRVLSVTFVYASKSQALFKTCSAEEPDLTVKRSQAKQLDRAASLFVILLVLRLGFAALKVTVMGFCV